MHRSYLWLLLMIVTRMLRYGRCEWIFHPGGAKVQLVSGGTLIADAMVTHGDYSLVLNNDGYAYENGSGTLYDTYYLEGLG